MMKMIELSLLLSLRCNGLALDSRLVRGLAWQGLYDTHDDNCISLLSLLLF